MRKEKAEKTVKSYLIFTLLPVAKLFNVAIGEEERNRIIKDRKESYPTIPVYWAEVQEG